jgi:uncharacterized protein
MHSLHLTLVFAGICALIQTGLTALVIMRRVQTSVDFLDGGDKTLLLRIRAHGNFIETVPMALLLIALLETKGLGVAWIATFGAVLVAGRLAHAACLVTNAVPWGRIAGMLATLAVISIAGVMCLVVFFR